jgi:sigma-B regulation protein RsbU (phosphoserine phosphatase)
VLAVMAIVIGYQAWHSVDALHFFLRGVERPFQLDSATPAISDLRKEAANAGLKKGDTLLSINGQPIRSRADVAARLRTALAGDEWAVAFEREAQPGLTVFRLARFNNDAGWMDWITAIFTDFIIRWFGIVLAFFVLWMRPRDPLAWLLLALLVSFGFLANSVGDVDEGWPLPWRAFAMFYRGAIGASWPLWMMLFGLDFPDPQSKIRLFGWTRWVLGVPQALLALTVAVFGTLQTTVGLPSRDSIPWLADLTTVGLTLSCACITVLFINISYKIARERAPNAKRRLKWLYWGMTTSLGPIFLFILYSWLFQKSIDSLPKPLIIAIILLLFIFPATLAYVIVVQKAMDVRVAVRQGLQYALAQRAMGIVTALVVMGVIWLTFESVTRDGMRSARQLTIIALAVLAVVLLQRVMAKARGWVDRMFFREQVETERVLAELGDEVRHIPDAETLKERVCRRISEALHVPRVEILADAAGAGFELALPISSGRSHLGVLGLGPKLSEEPYSRSDRHLLQTVATQAALALENVHLTRIVAEEATQRERLNHELEIAREVQERLLPQRPPVVQGLEFAGNCRPAQSIGGDAYDFFLTREGHLMATVADICGKGVPAALLMAGLQASLRGLCAGGVTDLGELMNRLNGLMWESTPRNRFATLWCGQFDRAARVLHHVSAGHGDPVVVRASGLVERPACRSLALGLTRASSYSFGALQMEPGDLIAVCTDGVTEARNPAGEEFGEDRWAAAVAEAAGFTPERIVSHVLHAVDSFAAGAEQHDDLTIILLKVPA